MSVSIRSWCVASLGALGLCLCTAQAEAGPYYALHPYPASAFGGLSIDTTSTGLVFGTSLMADYRLLHLHGLYTLFGGLRVHTLVGPLNINSFGDNHHIAIMPTARFEPQVPSPQTWHPYFVVGLGAIHQRGHTDRLDVPSEPWGVAVELTGGLTDTLDDRWSWYVEGGLVISTQPAAYVRVSGGVRYHFGPEGETPLIR